MSTFTLHFWLVDCVLVSHLLLARRRGTVDGEADVQWCPDGWRSVWQRGVNVESPASIPLIFPINLCLSGSLCHVA